MKVRSKKVQTMLFPQLITSFLFTNKIIYYLHQI